MLSRTRTRRTSTRTHAFGDMPTIATLENSVKIMVYARDPTHGPHVHVAYEGQERHRAVRVRIDTGKVVGGRPNALKAQDLRAALEWLAANQAYAMQRWREINPIVRRRPR